MSEQANITINRDILGTIHIVVGDFDYIQIQYQYPHNDNASTWRMAERIVALLDRPASSDTEKVEALMKRCQVGVGGRHALDKAHGILAECYGMLGALVQERDELRELTSRIASESEGGKAAEEMRRRFRSRLEGQGQR